MVLQIFSMYDKKSKIYQPPLYGHNAGHAMRTFTDVITQQKLLCSKYPEDFSIWMVGEWDDKLGRLLCLDHPTLVCEVADLLPATMEQMVRATVPENGETYEERSDEEKE